MSKLPGFKISFESTDKVLPLHEYLWSENFRQWNNGPLNFFFFFETCTEEPFVSSILSNEGNIIASILLIPLKCIASGYESFTGKLLSKYVPLKMPFHFFRCLIYSAFHKTFAKNLWKNYPFLAEISKIHFKMYITGNYDV